MLESYPHCKFSLLVFIEILSFNFKVFDTLSCYFKEVEEFGFICCFFPQWPPDVPIPFLNNPSFFEMLKLKFLGRLTHFFFITKLWFS